MTHRGFRLTATSDSPGIKKICMTAVIKMNVSMVSPVGDSFRRPLLKEGQRLEPLTLTHQL